MSNLLTLNQAASACGVSRRTINRWIARRMLTVVKPTPRSPRIRTADLERTLEKFTHKAVI